MKQHLRNACNEFHDRTASLTMLNLSGRGIGSTGMKKLRESCTDPRPSKMSARPQSPYRSPLVCLWLESNFLHSSAAEDLAQLIAVSPSLRHLHLGHNSLGNEGAKSLSNICFTQLQVFNLSDNDIGPAGVRGIAAALSRPDCVLRSLNMDSNRVGDDGLGALMEGLRNNVSLKCLDLSYNGITTKGLNVIREFLKSGENTTLELFQLEEEEDEDCLFHYSRCPPRSLGGTSQRRRSSCSCNRCHILSEIEYYLSLNHAGRHSFQNLSLSVALWPRILAKSSNRDPSIVYAALAVRPDVASFGNNFSLTAKHDTKM